MNTIQVKSEDIHCQTCAMKVQEAVSKVNGVQNINVNVPEQIVKIDFELPADEDQIKQAMDEAGFGITEH